MVEGGALSSKDCNEAGYGRLLAISSCRDCSLIRYGFFTRRCTYNGANRRLSFAARIIPDWCQLRCAGSYGDGEIASASASPSPGAEEDSLGPPRLRPPHLRKTWYGDFGDASESASPSPAAEGDE